MELIVVTGLSGAGKSHAIHCLEDLGYYCVDNMPPQLLGNFVTLAGANNSDFNRVAFVADIRGGQFFGELKHALEELSSFGVGYKIMFLEASDVEILKRYKETRRAHPLAPDGNIEAGITAEREKLSDLKAAADYIIDTTGIKTAALNAKIKALLNSSDKDTFTMMIESFGFKNGVPQNADIVLDARFLPNPFYVPSLKALTGKNKKIKNYVLSCPEAIRFAGRITGLILDLIPSYIREGKYHLTIAVGCTGGRHRSVVMTEELARRFEENGRTVSIKHRDL